jgi:AraC-like DNA-binding protein
MRCTLQMGEFAAVDDVRGRRTTRVYQSSSVRYEETLPQADLGRDVVCFWTLQVDPSAHSHVQHLLPDLTVDVISVDGRQPFVMGPPTTAVRVPLPAGQVNRGVRLRAGAARRLFDASPAELLDSIVPLSDVLSARSARGIDAAPADVHAHVAQLLRQSAAEKDPTVRSAINWLGKNWRSSVDDLSRQANWSNRELRRRFVAAIGMGPKLVQRMVRVQTALHLLQARQGRVALSDLALECGFADQAHMARELARFTDHTPTHLRRLAHAANGGFSVPP